MRGWTLLLSTFRALVRLRLDDAFQLLDRRILEEARGIYFGLTRGGGRIFVVARNLDPTRRVLDPNLPTNGIAALRGPWTDRPGRSWSGPGFSDLHQIRYRDGLLWIVNGRPPELLAVNPRTCQVVGAVPLASLVPAELQHEAPAARPDDRFHFNSLHFGRECLWVLAHNWQHGSFALALDYRSPAELVGHPRVRAICSGLGRSAHDLFADGDQLAVLDSAGGRLLFADGRSVRVGDRADDEPSFPRGLAVGDRHFFVASGSWGAERQQRATGPTHLTVVDRTSLEQVAVLQVGSFGNSSDLLLLDRTDWSDTPIGG